LLLKPALSCLTAVAEAMFPANPHGAPDWREAEVVQRTLDYLDELPPMPRRLFLALFTATELTAPVMVGCRCRFSHLSVEQRVEAIRMLRASRFTPRRLLGDALKATMTMMYVAHPKVLEHLGERPGGFGLAGALE
jgi:hypothetical protein